MKNIIVLISVVTFLSCEKNPVDNGFETYRIIDYTVTVKVISEEGSPLSQAWIEGFAFGSTHDYCADENGDIFIKKTQQFHEDENIPDHIPVNTFVYPCDSSNVDRLVKDIPLTRGTEYPLFIVKCSLIDEEESTTNTF